MVNKVFTLGGFLGFIATRRKTDGNGLCGERAGKECNYRHFRRKAGRKIFERTGKAGVDKGRRGPIAIFT
ncbi:MAG: hypothetical protein ACYSR5_03260 [Planctomycetota bacterium]